MKDNIDLESMMETDLSQMSSVERLTQLLNEKSDDVQPDNENTQPSDPVFYILMRNDLNSLNAGKAIAQGAHAMQAFASLTEVKKEKSLPVELLQLYNVWKQSTDQNYGKTIVLSVNKNSLDNIIGNIVYDCQNEMVYADTITDPTYPFIVENKEIARLLADNNENINIVSFLDNGSVQMERPEVTCGYIFCVSNNEKVKKYLEMHPLF